MFVGKTEVAEMTATTASIYWIPEPEAEVEQYMISVYKNEDELVAKVITDKNGHQIGETQYFAPSMHQNDPDQTRQTMTQPHKMLMDTTYSSTDYFVVSLENLEASTEYTYEVSGMNRFQENVYQKTGDFRTPVENSSVGIEEVENQTSGTKSTKLIRDGQLLILRDGKLYTPTGINAKF